MYRRDKRCATMSSASEKNSTFIPLNVRWTAEIEALYYLRLLPPRPLAIPRLAWHPPVLDEKDAPRSCCCSGFLAA